jgi:hypothetical protein
MMRLVTRGLMFGNLFEVRAPALVARYNRALEHLTGKRTKLEEFHIDISGYSPEIGDEFNDEFYLNPDGFNRKFILLSIDQKKCPLLNVRLSMSQDILRSYIEQNEEQLFVLTARDAVVGELINSVYSVDSPSDLFTIRTIEVEADTIGSDVEASEELSEKIEQFMKHKDGWWDDVLIAEMIELSKRTGNILRDPIHLARQTFEQKSFYTSHFGGIYLFRDVQEPGIINVSGTHDLTDLSLEYNCSLDNHYEIAAFLKINDLVEQITNTTFMTNSLAVLQQKMDFLVIDAAASNGEDLSNVSRRDLRDLRRKHRQDLPEAYHSLEKLMKSIIAGQQHFDLKPHDPAYFYLLRSKNHANKRLVNMLLSQLTPLDFRQLFICHKDAFYSAYRSWSDAKKSYAARFLEEEYVLDKSGARMQLFGPEPAMEENEPEIELAIWQGPWGPASMEQ